MLSGVLNFVLCFLEIQKEVGCNGKYGCDGPCSYKFAVGDTLKSCLLVRVINFNVKILYYNSL